MSGNILRLWMNSSITDDETPFYIEEFKQLGDALDISIELKMVSWNKAIENIMHAFKNEHEPDVFQIGSTFVPPLAHFDYLAPVPASFPMKSLIVNWMGNNCISNGTKLAVPWFSDTAVLVARKDILDKFGIMSSHIADWDGFCRVCGELAVQCTNSAGDGNLLFPLGFQIRPENGTLRYFASWLWAGGWNFPALDPIPEKIFDDEAVVRTFEYICKLIRINGITTKDVRIHPQQMYEQFRTQGRYIFYIGSWNGSIADTLRNQTKADSDEVNFTVLPLPSLIPNTKPWGGGTALAVSSRTRYPEEAWKVVEYLTSERFFEKWMEKSWDVPAFESIFWEKHAQNEHIRFIRKQCANSITYPSHLMWKRIERFICEDFGRFFWQVIDGSATENSIRSALKNADHSIMDFLRMTWEMDNYE